MKKSNCSFNSGRMVEPLSLKPNKDIKKLIDNVFGCSGYNAKRLEEACKIYKKMIEKNATICLTLAGAMTPIGMSGPIIDLMENGFVDFVISTGANLYHDMHRPFGYPMRQTSPHVNDSELHRYNKSRIYDVLIDDSETLTATDKSVIKAVKRLLEKNPHKTLEGCTEPLSTAEFHHELGELVLETAKNPEKSILTKASELNIPIYTSSPGDSSIGMNLVVPELLGKSILIHPVKDILETTAIVKNAKKNGAVEVGGGSPKNFYMQTQPTLWQILREKTGGHDYFIQLTTDSPQWGGVSGATPQEAVSWGKINAKSKDHAVVYSCASITFPLLCQYVLESCKPREQRQLYLKRKTLSS